MWRGDPSHEGWFEHGSDPDSGEMDWMTNDYWGHDDLGQAILDALAESGKDINALTIDDLAPFDEFHAGGKEATIRLARFGELTTGERVLDVGGGIGGPARRLATEFECHVTVVDLTASYVQAADELTNR
ncbi:MAG: 2-polyprenyl-3-methyl-5-hydroxy-6-metoxy-1,4-benzoquinol methylase [Candidatus Latescibacterota bacterium]|jgi:2-polyprenyl-3-methyl-5-hydroxy-6-metoxy-1,4-benzoquinol methylase